MALTSQSQIPRILESVWTLGFSTVPQRVRNTIIAVRKKRFSNRVMVLAEHKLQ